MHIIVNFRSPLTTGLCCLDRGGEPLERSVVEGIYMLCCTTSALWPDVCFIYYCHFKMKSWCVIICAVQVSKTLLLPVGARSADSRGYKFETQALKMIPLILWGAACSLKDWCRFRGSNVAMHVIYCSGAELQKLLRSEILFFYLSLGWQSWFLAFPNCSE